MLVEEEVVVVVLAALSRSCWVRRGVGLLHFDSEQNVHGRSNNASKSWIGLQ